MWLAKTRVYVLLMWLIMWWGTLGAGLLAGCAAGEDMAPPGDPPRTAGPTPLVWQPTLGRSADLELGARGRGFAVARGIIHLHSPHSHDACDYDPQPGGQLNAPCLADLRRGLCQTRQDFAMLTDHAAHMTEADFPPLFLTDSQAGDSPVYEGMELVGSSLRCDDAVASGQRVLLTVGGENALMPVGLHHHLGKTPQERADNMDAESPAAVQAFQAAGAAVLVPHGESRTIDLLRQLAGGGLDGMEVYNLHANIDPKIRTDYLGLDGLGAVAGLSPWLPATPTADGGPEPDLALLGFLLANDNQLGKFDTLLGEGRHLVPTLGSDIHENAFKQQLADGERGDSYRRLMRWFANYLLVPAGQPLTPALLHEALTHGRAFGVFHLFGPPVGFDFYAEGPAGQAAVELGGTATLGARLHLVAPRPLPADDRRADAVLRLSLLRVAPGATAAAVVQTRLLSAAELQAGVELVLDTATAGVGAYRAEVTVIPRHLAPLLGPALDPGPYLHEFPYLYSGVIYVEAAHVQRPAAARQAAAQ